MSDEKACDKSEFSGPLTLLGFWGFISLSISRCRLNSAGVLPPNDQCNLTGYRHVTREFDEYLDLLAADW